jgi:hypothetical protein
VGPGPGAVGLPPPIPTFRTSRSVPRSEGKSERGSSLGRESSSSRPTTRRSSFGSSRIFRMTPPSWPRSAKVSTSTSRRLRSSSMSRSNLSATSSVRGPRRSILRRSMDRESTPSRGSSRFPSRRRRALSRSTSGAFPGCEPSSMRRSRWRRARGMWRR